MAYFVEDEGGFREYESLSDALGDAAECIKAAQEWCDPGWPSWVDSICVFEAPSGSEFPDEDGKLLYIATETNVRPAKDGDGCDYWCDYEMRAVSADQVAPPAALEGGDA